MKPFRHSPFALAMFVCALVIGCSKSEPGDAGASSDGRAANAGGAAAADDKDQKYLEAAKTFVQKVMNEADVAYMEANVAADYVDHTPAPGQEPTRDGLKKLLVALKTGFPDLSVAPEELVVKGNKVSMRLRMQGTHKGPFAGLAPTGSKIDCMSIDVAAINDQGKVSEHWGAVDMLTLLGQLGQGKDLAGLSIDKK